MYRIAKITPWYYINREMVIYQVVVLSLSFYLSHLSSSTVKICLAQVLDKPKRYKLHTRLPKSMSSGIALIPRSIDWLIDLFKPSSPQ